ncbi:QWRF motif-containing protein 3 [Raphanus sativus]|nr:QWRF motif-containing protein 3 [Raphanus sativus]
MKSHENVSLKTSRGKSRVVSSRYLSPLSSSSPNRRNSTSNSSANNVVHLGLRKHDHRMSDGTLPIPNQKSSDVSFASTLTANKPGIKVSSKYLHDHAPTKGCTMRLQQQGSQSFRGTTETSVTKRTNSAARYGSSMSRWAMSPGRSLEAHQASSIYPSSNLKPPRGKGIGKLFNLGFDFFRSKKNKSSPISSSSSPLKPKTESSHQLKLMNNRLVQWRFVNARASAANNNVASRAKKQLLCAWDTLTKLQNLVLQERINLQKKNLEMKLAHVLLSQIKHLEAWEDMGRQHLSSISMTRQALHSLLSRVPLREGAKVNIESAVTIYRKGEAVSDAIISTVNSFAPTIEDIVQIASQLAEVVAQEKLMLEQCHDLLRMISELEFWMQADAGEELKVLPYDSTQKDFVYKTCSRLGPWFPLLFISVS